MVRYYRKGLRYYRSKEQYYRMPQFSNTRSPSFCRDTVRRRKLQRAKGKAVQNECVYVRFHPNLSNADPLLIVRLSYDSNPPKRNVEKHRLQ